MDSFRYGPLSPHTVHLCVDMQNLFAPGAPWATPWFERVLPQGRALAQAHAAQTVFTRFLPPRTPQDLPGTWRKFYETWRPLTLEHVDPRLLQLAPALAELVPPATVLDKTRYSPFHGTALTRQLAERGVSTLVISGTETDVCVASAALDAVDLGLRVVIARDAVCSSSDATHDAQMRLYHQRFSHQIEVAETAEILDAWRGG
jgi:nicotinamidase-related amidase